LGDNIGYFAGDGNVVGKNITVSGNITINKNSLPLNIDPEFQKAILEFSANLNAKVKDMKIPENENEELNKSIKQLAKDAEGIKSGQQIGEMKKSDIKNTLFRIGKNVLKVLPKTAETLALFTPLAPFSKQIGEGTGYLIETIQKES
jgi:hypothetical protein